MELFTKLFGRLLVFVYHCFDRIVIHGYLSGLSRPKQVVYFFRNVVRVPMVDKEVIAQNARPSIADGSGRLLAIAIPMEVGGKWCWVAEHQRREIDLSRVRRSIRISSENSSASEPRQACEPRGHGEEGWHPRKWMRGKSRWSGHRGQALLLCSGQQFVRCNGATPDSGWRVQSSKVYLPADFSRCLQRCPGDTQGIADIGKHWRLGCPKTLWPPSPVAVGN